ncbi:MAG: ABC transporter ATP-binding protein [Acidobacteria bacterium]|nr:ABC transporter ATP-binding protein [Acidobacteriota bacterium]
MTTGPAIRTSDLEKRFGRNRVLRGLDLEIAPGSIYALVGANGAGKTTTLKILLNLIRPTSGQSSILGVESRRITPAQLARVGYVSENMKLPEWMRMDAFLAYLKPFYPTWDDALAAELVQLLDLPVGRRLSELSRGMKMKAALVSALAFHPSVLILDEPFSGLDPMVRDDLITAVLDRAGETTILISSHDLAEIESFASHVGYLDEGRLRFSEEMASLSLRFREVEVALDAPPALPAGWPETWLRPETSSALVRFVESRYDPQRTEADVRRLFPAARRVEANPMPLRAIFVTLARSARKAA